MTMESDVRSLVGELYEQLPVLCPEGASLRHLDANASEREPTRFSAFSWSIRLPQPSRGTETTRKRTQLTLDVDDPRALPESP